ncbi:hypothetical protein EKO04_004401 [Ascochyta lentis]|uniref:Uncharacterized protein n=1 Tax=Ascochyta lentis TaxID=205686 RepID=A0A8H7MIQ6_9PLEO|nr:hypothetical protein EKO04_004401 [Ascochyta lentis]
MSAGHSTTAPCATSPAPEVSMTDAEQTRPAGGDSEMQDAGEVRPSYTYRKKLTELGRAEREAVLSPYPELYADKLTMSDGFALSTEGIFDLRGADIPTHLPPFIREANRRECILGLQMPDSTIDEEDMTPDDEFQEPPPPIFIGASIKPQESGPQKRDNEGQAKGNKKQKKKGGNKSNAGPSTQPALKDMVKVALHLDSQTPHIEITTRKLGAAKGKNDLLRLRLFASDLELSHKGSIYLKITTDIIKFDEEVTTSTGGNVEMSEVNDMNNAGQIVMLGFALKPARRNWSGLPESELCAIRARTRQESIRDKTLTRDLAVQNLDKAQFVYLLFPLYGESDRKIWEDINAHMRRVFTLAKRIGNFWFYRLQLAANGIEANKLEESSLPRIRFEVPRWLVDVWEFECRNINGKVEIIKAMPRSWKYHKFFDQYNNPDESAFLLKLGVQGEEARQNRDLNEYVQNKNGNHFRGLWTELGEPGHYAVQIFMSNNEELDERDIRMPGLDTRVELNVDAFDPANPVQARTRRYRGAVCEDIFNNGASFCCVVRGQKFSGNLALGIEFPLLVSYTIDTVPQERQMLAIRQLQEINSLSKPSGVDLKALFLGCRKPAPQVEFLALETKPEQLATLKANLRSRRSNEMQTASVVATTTSLSGLTVIQGPPGTGKTDTAISIGSAHLQMGRKVMFTAPMNEAVVNLHESFVKGVANGKALSLNDSQYVLFTGAHRTISAADRLRHTQELKTQDPTVSEEDVEFMLNAGNIIAHYARTTSGAKTPGYEWTFGYKLRKMIELWASLPVDIAHPYRADARRYMEYTALVPVTHDRADKKDLLAALGSLEEFLAHYYLKHEVVAVFVTLSSSAHITLVTSFDPVELLIDEGAHESLAGLAVPCGAYKHSIKHITLAGDHNQGKPVYIAKDSNLGHGALSRNLFAELAKDPSQQHPVFLLGESYRMTPDLLTFVQKFYPPGALKAFDGAGNIDRELQNSLRQFWALRLRESFQGKSSQVCIDVSGRENAHEQVSNSTTKCNRGEARVIADLCKELLSFEPVSTTGNKCRAVNADDINIVTPYTGQVLEIRKALLAHGITTIRNTWTTAHSQGKQGGLTIFSPVINIGTTQPQGNDKIPMSFLVY